MALETYRRKRRFDVTPEPRGSAARRKGNRFVIQKHAARRLHYDFRLELDGVMKSWAVTRGPSLVAGEKRLAVQVEDHPLEYNSFEGTIPEGEYGGGTVLIWDRGRWYPDGDPQRGLEKGRLTFEIEGEKLRGKWHLVRMQRRARESRVNWLLIKANDEWARGSRDPDVLEELPLSVASRRSIAEIAEGKGRRRVWHSNRSADTRPRTLADSGDRGTAGRRKAARSPRRARTARKQAKPGHKDGEAPRQGTALPDFVPPSLATLRATAPSGHGWVHEIKFDGYRIQARLDHGKVRLLTRKGLDWTGKFPNIAAAIAGLAAATALIDGEVVVEDEKGLSSFAALQAALKAGRSDAFKYYVFDLLHLDGRDLASLPLLERKAELRRLIGTGGGPIRLSEHFEEEGAVVLQHACEMGGEGIVSKRSDAPYRSGRLETFIKTKCANAQELVVGGYSPSTAMPRAVGALVVGYYDDGQFVYAGRIGTGYSHAVARELWQRLQPLAITRPAFDRIPRSETRRRDVCWVEPRMVIESEFRGWTSDGLLRQAAFKGVREDKPAREVFREMPVMAKASTSKRSALRSRVAAEAGRAMTRQSAGRRSGGRAAPARQPSASAAKRRRDADVRFTHPERVYWVDVGITKQDLADYYRRVWPLMAPHLVNRPLALVRCPDGTSGECFFQKHASAGLTERNLRVVVDSNRRQVLAVEGLDGLLSLVQAGVLEVHVRGSTIDRLDLCTRIVFDIDPGEDVRWPQVIAAAREVRERLAGVGLRSFVKLTGGKGLHVVLPCEGADWETTKSFAQAVALAMTADHPDRYVAKMTKSIRRGRIFVDYLRNSLEQTSVAAYSTRARAGAPVSVPVTWEELARTRAGSQYTVLNLGKRLAGLRQDPWKDIGRVKQKLPDLRSLRAR
ncbi:MAG TPA: DNA ligase D [Xanthobacteraceae bacterium]